MKKFFAIAAAILISVASFAQETNKDENGNYKFGGYETNKFWDNWFVGVGGGVDMSYDAKKADFSTALDVTVGKWIEPCFGVRAGYYGIHNVAPATDNSVANHLLHADFLWNISNQFWGYKEERLINVIPYFHADAWLGDQGKEIGAGFGLLAPIRLSEKLSIPIDLRGCILHGEQLQGDGLAGIATLTAGLAYNLGRSNWTRVSTTAAAAAAAIAAAKAAQKAAEDKVAGAQKAANDATTAAKNAQDEAKQLVDEAKKAASANVDGLFDEPVVVYFQIGKSVLSKAEKAHAEYAIKNIIARGENVKFTLNGSADTGTGSKARNEQLSKERAQTVYNLVDELGVSRENITVVEWDGTERFATPELNRAVIIEKQ